MANQLKKITIFEASTLEEAYSNASKEYNYSLVDLSSEVIQNPTNGFFGFFKKNAIIKVIEIKKEEQPLQEDKEKSTNNDLKSTDITKEIKEKVNELFSYLCYEIEDIEVSMYDEKTVLIHFTGDDSALLIGKEGYRYKAISYVLFNLIHDNYGLMLRLEIAQFLQSQEESIQKYIDSILPKIESTPYFKTKSLDGILIHIAITILRKELPNKYIAVKQNINKEKYILIKEYKTND